MKKSYKHRTPVLGIPVVGMDDGIWPEVEMRRALIIENQLLGAMQGVRSAVFDEGHFWLDQVSELDFRVVVEATGPSVALSGIVNRGYFESRNTVVWEGLQRGYEYWLYVSWTTKLYTDRTAFRPVVSRFRKSVNVKSLTLVARVNLRGSRREIDLSPDGKIVAGDLATHAGDRINPHGPELEQARLRVREQLNFAPSDDSAAPLVRVEDRRPKGAPLIVTDGDLMFQDARMAVAISDDGDEALATQSKSLVGALNELAAHRVALVDFESGGPDGVTLCLDDAEEARSTLGAQVSARSVDALGKIGEVAVIANRDDPDLQPGQLVVHNGGDAGLALRAVVYYR